MLSLESIFFYAPWTLVSKLAVLSRGQRHGDRRQKISIAVIQFASSAVEHAVDNQVGLEVLHERLPVLGRYREKHSGHGRIELQRSLPQRFCHANTESCLVAGVDFSNLVVVHFVDFFQGQGLPKVLSGLPPCCDNGQPIALFRHRCRLWHSWFNDRRCGRWYLGFIGE